MENKEDLYTLLNKVKKEKLLCYNCKKDSGQYILTLDDLFNKVPSGWLVLEYHSEYPPYKVCSEKCLREISKNI